MEPMECDELVEQVTNYLEDALNPRDMTRLDHHLRSCIGCEAYLGEIRVTQRLMARLPAELPSDKLLFDLLVSYYRSSERVSA